MLHALLIGEERYQLRHEDKRLQEARVLSQRTDQRGAWMDVLLTSTPSPLETDAHHRKTRLAETRRKNRRPMVRHLHTSARRLRVPLLCSRARNRLAIVEIAVEEVAEATVAELQHNGVAVDGVDESPRPSKSSSNTPRPHADLLGDHLRNLRAGLLCTVLVKGPRTSKR